jgi:hypothetical protein
VARVPVGGARPLPMRKSHPYGEGAGGGRPPLATGMPKDLRQCLKCGGPGRCHREVLLKYGATFGQSRESHPGGAGAGGGRPALEMGLPKELRQALKCGGTWRLPRQGLFKCSTIGLDSEAAPEVWGSMPLPRQVLCQ